MSVLECSICPQNCCNRKGKSRTTIFPLEYVNLKTSIKTEFDEDKIVLSTNSNGDCKSLVNSKCSSYEDRPITCWTYPLTMNSKKELFISANCFSVPKILDGILKKDPETLEYLSREKSKLEDLHTDIHTEMEENMKNYPIQIKLNLK